MNLKRRVKKQLKKRGLWGSKIVQFVGLGLLALATVAVLAFALREPQPVAAENAPATSPKPIATTAAAAAPKVAFMGDSYTAGTGSTSPANRWTTKTASALGWEELNFGQGGSGFTGGGGPGTDGKERLSYPDMIPAVAAAKPDMVVIATAGNDFNRGPSAFEPAAAAFFPALRAALPDAKIVVVSTFWRGPGAHKDLAALNDSLRSGAAAVNGTYLDLGDAFQAAQGKGWLASDQIHPNDAGHAELAAEVAKAFSATPAAHG